MRTRWTGANGRYQAACEQGHCALTGGAATSKHEGQIFALLHYAIGPGQHDRRIRIGTRIVRLDMTFPLAGGRILAVEYDGAYWHQGQEVRDMRKTDMVAWSGQYRVLRIREDPLQPLTPLDVQVPRRADAAVCAQLTLLHLFHESWADIDADGHLRIRAFLNASAQRLALPDIRCEACREVQDHIESRPPTTGGLTHSLVGSTRRHPR